MDLKRVKMEEKHRKIKNKNYRQFLDSGIITTLKEEDIIKALNNIRGRNVREARALVILLYYTGCRPNEALKLKAKDIQKNQSYILVKLEGSKGGLPRTIFLPIKKPLVKELYTYCSSLFNEMYCFFHFRGNYVRIAETPKGIKRYPELAGKLGYYFGKWFFNVEGGISPYFLRHNRFSKLSEAGLSMQDIRMLKGSKTLESVNCYLHLSAKAAKNIAKKID